MMHVVVGGRAAGEECEWERMSAEDLASLASTPTLFGGPKTFVLGGALNDAQRGEEFLEMAEVFARSPHTFVFEEEKLLKAPAEALQRAGAKIKVQKKEKKERGFDEFGLVAALSARDRKKLWLALMAALRAGDKPEAIAGLLHWKARQMRDLKLSRALLALYHDSHRGAGDLDLLLERFALTL